VANGRKAEAAGHDALLIREIGFLEKSIERLGERFAIEKKDALDTWDIENLEKLVDRSRIFFQPEAAVLLNSLFRVRSRIREGEDAAEVMEFCQKVEALIRSSLVWFTAAPHRLIRNFGVLEKNDS